MENKVWQALATLVRKGSDELSGGDPTLGGEPRIPKLPRKEGDSGWREVHGFCEFMNELGLLRIYE